MLKNILNLKGAQTLNKNQQKEITGGNRGGILFGCNSSCGFQGQTCHPNNICGEPGKCQLVGTINNGVGSQSLQCVSL